MAQNLPADPSLTLEQDTYLRIKYLGALIYKESINSNFFSERLQLESTQRSTNPQGQPETVRTPLVTLAITLGFDPDLVFDLAACNQPLHPAIVPVVDPAIAPSCDPSLGGASFVDEAFNLTTLADDLERIPVDSNDTYTVEG